jgi:hypothetical protein
MKAIYIALMVLFLGACAVKFPAYQTKTQVAHCDMVCKKQLVTCQKYCRNNCVQCDTYAMQQTSDRYHRYVNEQSMRGGLFIRRLNSYRDPLQCRKTTCNCAIDYQTCSQSCRGVIHKQLAAPSVCT